MTALVSIAPSSWTLFRLLLASLLLLRYVHHCPCTTATNDNYHSNKKNYSVDATAFITATTTPKKNQQPPVFASSAAATATTTKTSSPSSALLYANSLDNNDDDANKKDQNNKNTKMRAWNCHGRNQRDLVDRMVQANIVRTESVRDVLYRVDRQQYAPNQQSQQQSHANPYMDAPQPIGLGQTISAPHMHAHVLEEIYPYLKASKASQVKILDVGCGSGYLTAALGRWVAPLEELQASSSGGGDSAGAAPSEGTTTSTSSLLDQNKTGLVYGIDIYPHLVDLSRKNMEKEDKDLLSNKIVQLQVSDGWKGLPDASPFDAIHVGAAAAEFPRALLEQLKVGGVLIIPVGPEGGVQNLYRAERLSDGFTQEDFRITELLGVRYVPLVQQQETRN